MLGLPLRQIPDAIGQDGVVVDRHPLGRGQLGDGLQAGDDPASGIVEFGPPGVVIIAKIKDIGGVRLDRHGLGRRDVVDSGNADGGINRAVGVRIVDDV